MVKKKKAAYNFKMFLIIRVTPFFVDNVWLLAKFVWVCDFEFSFNMSTTRSHGTSSTKTSIVTTSLDYLAIMFKFAHRVAFVSFSSISKSTVMPEAMSEKSFGCQHSSATSWGWQLRCSWTSPITALTSTQKYNDIDHSEVKTCAQRRDHSLLVGGVQRTQRCCFSMRIRHHPRE